MSYRCEITKRVVMDVPLNKVVALTRPKTYTRWILNEETRQFEEVVIGEGRETVRELNLSTEGVSIWESWTEAERATFLKQSR
jgi:hypothetical protein